MNAPDSAPLTGTAGDRTPEPPVPLRSFVLHDVQGLHGGRALWAVNRTTIIQQVGLPPVGGSGLWEKRYQVRLSLDQWREAERLVGACHFLILTLPKRFGVPDEGRPCISVVAKSGIGAKVCKWANDHHPDFDPLYGYLLQLCRTEEANLVREGAFEWEWLPDGFERPW